MVSKKTDAADAAPEAAAEPVLDGVNVTPFVPDVDRVASLSVNADGEPAQTPGFVLLAEPDQGLTQP